MARTAMSIKVEAFLKQADRPQRKTRDQSSLLREMIAMRAYYLAEERGFEPGHEEEDWHRAEWELYNILVFSREGLI